ncbi:MAG: hypothetical protein ACOX6M_13180 [Armatimonadota bacterium]
MNVSNYPDADDDSPSLSADGSKVAWRSYPRRELRKCASRTRTARGPCNVTDYPDAGDTSPSLSADGSKVAWMRSYRDGNYVSVCVANTDGTGLVNVLEPQRLRWRPLPQRRWEQGRLGEQRDGDFEVYVANTDGTGDARERLEPQRRSRLAAPRSAPMEARSPGMSDRRDGDWEVYVANTDGTGTPPVNVSHDSNDGYDGLPSLSADGSKVAWTRD